MNWVFKHFDAPRLGAWLSAGFIGYLGLNRLIEAVIPNIYLILVYTYIQAHH